MLRTLEHLLNNYPAQDLSRRVSAFGEFEKIKLQPAGEFCSWLRELPGEDKAVNNISETHLR